MTIPVLFARNDSVYKTLPGTDCYDIERDARTYAGQHAVIAHPPCRSWGVLKHMAKPRPAERKLAIWSILKIRQLGGVLEHPRGSDLWNVMSLPPPGQIDEFGGFTLPLFQLWFGHRCEKATLLYICGISPKEVPAIPLFLGAPTHVVAKSKSKHRALPEISKADRERTPIEFAKFLIEIARRIQTKKEKAAA